jgi:hypothetical protein
MLEYLTADTYTKRHSEHRQGISDRLSSLERDIFEVDIKFCGMDLTHLKVGSLVATVELALDGEAMQGRRGYRSGVRPNHWMPGREYAFIGQLDFVGREWLKPGETCEARGSFIIAEQDAGSCIPGLSWPVGEAYKIVGHCKLVSIQEPYKPASHT